MTFDELKVTPLRERWEIRATYSSRGDYTCSVSYSHTDGMYVWIVRRGRSPTFECCGDMAGLEDAMDMAENILDALSKSAMLER